MNGGIFIITGEPSGELYGALLARALRSLNGDLHICGVGGERMRAEGVDLLAGITGAFGLIEAVSSVGTLREVFSKIKDALRRERPSVVVLIDFPDFNLRVAREAKSLGIKVLYYVSPQVWAWRRKRTRRITELSDRIAVVLPFEEKIYREAGADCEFVGHPIMEEIENTKGGRSFIRESLGLEPDREVLALLPGSRRHELKRLMPLFASVVERFKVAHPGFQYVLPMAPNLSSADFQEWTGILDGLGVRTVSGMSTEVLSAADLALIASGTSTLQAALCGVPMVVVYRLFPLTYLLGRLLVNVKYISLVNLLLDREVVKELIQYRADTDNTVRELDRIIRDDGVRRYMAESFGEIRALYEGRRASERVAQMVAEMSGWGR
ncbi:MAG TPA: lipid-A-disaccharide synthase [Nitrospirae bacterium]|nr:lipid-A-disaccharide synthase [Nitrospirota bacterium]